MTLEESANCVVVAAKRGGEIALRRMHGARDDARADVNGVVRRHLDARKASFAPGGRGQATGMEYGGITPLGLPAAGPCWWTRRGGAPGS